MTPGPFGLALALVVGLVLGLLGGGGSILAVPIFVYVFHVPDKPAIAMSLAVVGMSAFVGFLTHWRQGTVHFRIAVPFGLFAMAAAYFTARLTHFVPAPLQMALFAVFAFTAAFFMLRDSLRRAPGRAPGRATGSAPASAPASAPGADGPAAEDPVDGTRTRFTPLVGLQAIGVGALTSLIGAGGGFVIVPALVLLARVPVKPAVGSSLLIITLNALSGFVGYIGQVPIDWPLIGSFTAIAAVGAVAGTRLNRRLPQARIKQGFAILIIVLGGYLVLRRLF